MIRGVHSLFYSSDPEAPRAFFQLPFPAPTSARAG